MFEFRDAISVLHFDDAMLDRIRREPHRLIREDDVPPEVAALGQLVAAPTEMHELGPVLGLSPGGPAQPDVVIVGICQGRARRADKQCWLQMGPTVEAVCILDFAFRVAQRWKCPLEIWILDQEYAFSVVDPRLDSDPETELLVGASLALWCQSRYPSASVRQTSNMGVRADLYSIVTNVDVAKLYGTGVPKPYNSSGRVFWQELQFFATLAVFLRPAIRERKRVWAVADHEQLRPMAAAWGLADNQMRIITLWPCPRLRWEPPSRRNYGLMGYTEKFLAQTKAGSRRMFHGVSPEDMLFFNMTTSQIDRCLSSTVGGPIYADTLIEILRYLGGLVEADQLQSKSNAIDALHEGLMRLRQSPG